MAGVAAASWLLRRPLAPLLLRSRHRYAFGSRCCSSASVAELKQLLERAVSSQAELHSQLLAQSSVAVQRTKMLEKSLEEAAADRLELREEVKKLSVDVHVMRQEMVDDTVMKGMRIPRKGVTGRGAQSRMSYRPSVEDAEKQPSHVCELSHDNLAGLAMSGNHSAQRERLVREIMAVEGIPWGKAHAILDSFDDYNEKYYWIETMPYRIGITAAFVGGVLGSLMVFWKPVALWYGENIAGEELPEDVKDINEMTTNQVGTWTWGWMEPMIGTASFALLCAQFTRTQVSRINMKTYGDLLLQYRGNRLADKFPQYDRSMMRAWAKHIPRVGLNFFPIYEHRTGLKGPTSGL